MGPRSAVRRLFRARNAPEAAEWDEWFVAHYEGAARQVISFLRDDSVLFEGKRVADVGCGDGLIDLGLVHHGKPGCLVGYDINPVDSDHLLKWAAEHGVCERLPPQLHFEVCGATSIPAADSSYDVVVSWSAFEHIADPEAVAREIQRVLKPDGVLFLQLWPFYGSQHGAHLQELFPQGWVQHTLTLEQVNSGIYASAREEWWKEHKINAFATLNRITLDRLQDALRLAGFRLCRVELMSHTVILAPDVQHLPLSELMISGVVLTARPST